MNRKQFLSSACALCGLGVVGSLAVLESCKKSSTHTPQGPTVNFTLDISQPANTALNSVGGSVATQGVVIARTGGSTWACVAQACTHQGCNIGYNSNAIRFDCPCHGATFDTNGNGVNGPSEIPVKKYAVTQNGNILTVKG